MKRFLLLFALVMFGVSTAFAQSTSLFGASAPSVAAKWSATLRPSDVRHGETARIFVTAKVPKGWHIYSLTQPKGGPIATSIKVSPNATLQVIGKAKQPKPKIVHDEGFGINVELLEGLVQFALPVKVAAKAPPESVVTLQIRSMMCNDKTCLPPTDTTLRIRVRVAKGSARASRIADASTESSVGGTGSGTAGSINTAGEKVSSSTRANPRLLVAIAQDGAPDSVASQVRRAQNGGVLTYLAFAFGAGLLALLTPCVFPMIPITVGVFSKPLAEGSRRDWLGPVAYCAGIVGTFTILGLAVSAFFGASGITQLAANPWLNLVMAALFIVLALNLFGVFEIVVPSKIINRVQPQAPVSQAPASNATSTRSRVAAPLLMGLLFTLTSFTCTVPFVATALASSSQGEVWWPLLGMLAFSSAFALPFFALALFPQWLSRLPKSGSWLRSTKVVMGFLELAAAVKFLSQADFSLQLQLLTRPVFLALWAVIAVMAALYLLCWIRFPHDQSSTRPTMARRALGVAFGVTGVYFLLAINGASLGELEAYAPPRSYGSMSVASAQHSNGQWQSDYQQARALAQREGKLLLINFTGYACTNCRLMENKVFPQPSVRDALKAVVAVELYTDGSDALSKSNSAMQQQKFGTVSLPLYVVISPKNEREIARLEGLHRDPQTFVQFVQNAQSSTRLAARRT